MKNASSILLTSFSFALVTNLDVSDILVFLMPIFDKFSLFFWGRCIDWDANKWHIRIKYAILCLEYANVYMRLNRSYLLDVSNWRHIVDM